MVRVRLFAAPRDAVGEPTIDVPLPPRATAADLLAAACAHHPPLARWRDHLRVAVNRRLAGPGDSVRETDEVALLPPVSGGARHVELVDAGALSVDAALAAVPPGAGAAVAFVGLARPDRGTERLEFDAYREMALDDLERVAREAEAKFHLLDVTIRHRLGTVPVPDAAVLVLCVAAHRREAFEAAQWIMDRLKADVAVWKKEVGAGERWIHPGTGR